MKNTTWNKGLNVGEKPPLSLDQVQLIKLHLSQVGNIRDIALFSLAIDSSLRGVDLVSLRVCDLSRGGELLENPTITQKKTQNTQKTQKGKVTLDLIPYTLEALRELIDSENKSDYDYVFTSQRKGKGSGKPLSPGHYRRLVKTWLDNVNINSKIYSSHSIRRTRLAMIYEATGNIRVVQFLGGHSSTKNTESYLGITKEHALRIAKKHRIF